MLTAARTTIKDKLLFFQNIGICAISIEIPPYYAHPLIPVKQNIIYKKLLSKAADLIFKCGMYVAAASAFLLFRHKTRLKPLVTSDHPILSGRFQNFIKPNRFSHILFKSAFQSNSHIFFENSTAALLFFCEF